MTSLDILDAIHHLAPGAQFTFNDTDLSTLEWLSTDIDRPTDAEILAAVPVVKELKAAEVAAQAAAKIAILKRLGLTADELKTVLS